MFEQVPHPDRKSQTPCPASRQENRLNGDRSRWLALGLCLSFSGISSGCTVSSSASSSLQTVAARPQNAAIASPVVNTPKVAWEDLMGVCDGQGAIAAAPYQSSDNAPQRNVVFAHRDVSQDEGFNFYNSHLFTRTWQPTQPEKVQLVVCISENQRYEHLESCEYQTGRYALHRYRNTIEVQLREANTSKILDTAKFDSEARRCPMTKPIGDELEWHWSGQLPDRELYTWLKPYLHEVTVEQTTAGDRVSGQPIARSTPTQM